MTKYEIGTEVFKPMVKSFFKICEDVVSFGKKHPELLDDPDFRNMIHDLDDGLDVVKNTKDLINDL